MDTDQTPQLRRILILDDDSDYRRLLQTFLHGAFPDVEVGEYDPSAQGLPDEEFDWGAWDVLILDYNLQINGVTGLDILRANSNPLQFPATIMLTGAGDEAIAVRAMKSGVLDYLRKEQLKKSHLKEAITTAFVRHQEERRKLQAMKSVREMVRQETARMANQYKSRYERLLQEEQAHLQNELARLEKELQQKQSALKTVLAEKQAAERARADAEKEIARLRQQEQHLSKTGDEDALAELRTELEGARERLAQLGEELAEARRLQSSAEEELLKTNWKKEQEETNRQQLEEDLAGFKQEMAQQEKSQSRVAAQMDTLLEIKARMKARRIEEERRSNTSLLDDIAGQLDTDDD